MNIQQSYLNFGIVVSNLAESVSFKMWFSWIFLPILHQHVTDWIPHWWLEAKTHQTMSLDLDLIWWPTLDLDGPQAAQLPDPLQWQAAARRWKAIIYDRFRQKFSACQSHPAGASQAQYLPQDKLNFSSAHFQSWKSSKLHPLLSGFSPDGLVWKLPVKSGRWKMMTAVLFRFFSLFSAVKYNSLQERITSHKDSKQVWFFALGLSGWVDISRRLF